MLRIYKMSSVLTTERGTCSEELFVSTAAGANYRNSHQRCSHDWDEECRLTDDGPEALRFRRCLQFTRNVVHFAICVDDRCLIRLAVVSGTLLTNTVSCSRL